jgi:hypothetical protein
VTPARSSNFRRWSLLLSARRSEAYPSAMTPNQGSTGYATMTMGGRIGGPVIELGTCN